MSSPPQELWRWFVATKHMTHNGSNHNYKTHVKMAVTMAIKHTTHNGSNHSYKAHVKMAVTMATKHMTHKDSKRCDEVERINSWQSTDFNRKRVIL